MSVKESKQFAITQMDQMLHFDGSKEYIDKINENRVSYKSIIKYVTPQYRQIITKYSNTKELIMQQPHPTPIYLNSTYQNSSQSQYSHLLYLIQNHPSFQAKVNSFLLLFPNQQLTFDGLVKLVSLIYALLLPEMPKNLQRKLAVELVNTMQVQADVVTYTNLLECLLKIASDLIENIDVKSAIGILQLIHSRITDKFIISTTNPQKKHKLLTNIKLQILDTEQVLTQTQLAQKMHRRASELIYFEQKVQIQQDVNIEPWEIIITKLKDKPEQIIPLGFVLEQFCFDYIGNNFEIRNSYRLKGNKNIVVPDKVEFWVSLNGNIGNSIRDKVVNQQTYYNCPIIGISHLPQAINPPQFKIYNMYRINQVFSRINYYQKLKQMPAGSGQSANAGQNKYFNILSEFYDRDQFNIDQLALTKEKFIIRRKEQALGIQGKETVKKQQKDFQDQARLLPQRIAKAKFQFLTQKRLEDNIKDLTKNLRVSMQQDKNINVFMQKYLSAQPLPSDSQNPFKTDILSLAQKPPLQILMLGRAKSGKTTLSRSIAKQYNLIHISIETTINKILERQTFFKQNPPEADEDGNVKGGLLKIEECILEDIENGNKIDNQDLLDVINVELRKESTQAKGFILDLPFQYSPFWYQAVISNKIFIPKIGCRFFNRIIEIDQSQEQWAHFLKGLMIKPQDLTTTSSLDRFLRSKPKPALQQGQEQPAQQQQKPAPLIQSNLLQTTWENSVLPLIEHISNQMNPLHYLKIKNSYQSVDQLLSYLSDYLYKIPQPKKIEGNQKQLLTVGLEQLKIARKWSPWGIVDCVELNKGRIVNGKFQFAAEYGGRVFVFENQNNFNLFIESPRKYLTKLPELPKKTNIVIAGPRRAGKKTIAKLLSQIYGLKVIDFQQILKSVLQKQKHQETHVPSNPDKTSKGVHLSQAEFKQFTKGGVLNAKDVLPIILHSLGIPLQKKPPNWGVEKTEEEGNAEQIPEQKKAPPKKPKKKEKNDDERPKTPPLEDLSLKQIIPVINHKGKLDQIKGYILIGFPHNQEQLNAIKSFNIPIDKYILLSDNSEENPFKTLSKRLTDAEMEQVANFMTGIGPVKQALGQEVFKEITNLQLSPQEIINKIRQFIDPFYPKTDEDNLNRVCADKQEDGDPIPMGFCGNFCPVTLSNQWLIKGKEQFQAGFQGRRFKFTGEAELNSFKQNPTKYINKQNLVIPPRVMFIGIRGVGLRTQLQKLNQKYKIPILNFKQNLIQQLQNEKNKRKTERYYNKGFKPPQFNEQQQLIEDPQLNEQAADFDRPALQVQIVKRMFNGINEIFINGNYYDVEEEAVQTPFVDLLANARKLPQVVFILKSEEPKWLERNLDKKKIQNELDEMKQRKIQQKRKLQQDAKAAAKLTGQNYQQQEYKVEDDPQIPKLQQLIAQKQEGLKAQRQADSAKLDELAEAFKAWNVDVIEIKCERQAKHVNDRINFAIKPYLQDRLSRWQQNAMLPIQRHRARDFLNNYIALESRFGHLNPFTLMRPVQSYPLIYNDRIYYLNDEEERDRVMRNPKLLEANSAVPNDIKIVPSAAVIGLPKTGKTTLSTSLSKRLGMIKLSLQSIVQQFCTEHKDKKIIDILQTIRKGRPLSDENAIDLIQKRVHMTDCQKSGWILDGFPTNRQQCELLNKRGLLPYNVFTIKLSDTDIKKRALNHHLKTPGLKDYDYDWDIEIINKRITQNRDRLLQVEVYFLTKFNNIRAIDGKISKWGMFEEAKIQMQKKIKNKKQLIRALITHSATAASNVGFNFNCIINNLSDFGIFCPISYKIRREYVKLCPRHHRNIAFYNKKIYLFSSQKQLNDFIANSEGYKNKGNAFNPPQQIFEEQIVQITSKAENKGFCMVDLSRKKLTRGCPAFILKYKGKYYGTSTASNMKLFVKNPVLFEMVKLQDKLPIQFEKKSDLKKLAKQNDCTAFLQHHLSNILMKSLAQLGYRRPKFPTLGSKQSALKFLSISLKANNPNKDDQYRQKYLQKLDRFIKQCSFSQEIREQLDRKAKGPWQAHDEQNLLKLSEQYNKFLTEVNSVDKTKYFSQFIR